MTGTRRGGETGGWGGTLFLCAPLLRSRPRRATVLSICSAPLLDSCRAMESAGRTGNSCRKREGRVEYGVEDDFFVLFRVRRFDVDYPLLCTIRTTMARHGWWPCLPATIQARYFLASAVTYRKRLALKLFFSSLFLRRFYFFFFFSRTHIPPCSLYF